MCKLGYIVSNRKLKNIESFIGVTNDINSVIGENKPILIIGLENARKYATNFCILNKKISENIFWTFDKNERKVDFDNDIEKFYEYTINNTIKSVRYTYVNIFNLTLKNAKKIINLVCSNQTNTIFISNDMLYLLIGENVLGFSLKQFDFIGINKDKILSKLRRNTNNIIYTNDFMCGHKIRHLINNKRYATPYFLELMNK